MITLSVEGRAYSVEFRHMRKTDGRQNTGLGRKAPIRAVTTCVVIAWAEPIDGLIDYVAIENAICANDDPFSRKFGRHLALERAVAACKPLRAIQRAFLDAYRAVDPPAYDLQLTTEKLLPAAERNQRWAAGWEKRLARQLARADALDRAAPLRRTDAEHGGAL